MKFSVFATPFIIALALISPAMGCSSSPSVNRQIMDLLNRIFSLLTQISIQLETPRPPLPLQQLPVLHLLVKLKENNSLLPTHKVDTFQFACPMPPVVLTDQTNTKLMESTSAMISKETKSKDQLSLMVPNLDDTTSVWPCDHNSFSI